MITRTEIRKDVLQESVEAVVTTTSVVAGIVITAVRDVTRALGSLATDIFEIREGARRAEHEADDQAGPDHLRAV
ncbi:MAG TPA: hypothetical protein VHG70_17220 [Nocardioidaceae bacterium]|nr:hypothetical protein [Nocardioidaceae bacterium]